MWLLWYLYIILSTRVRLALTWSLQNSTWLTELIFSPKIHFISNVLLNYFNVCTYLPTKVINTTYELGHDINGYTLGLCSVVMSFSGVTGTCFSVYQKGLGMLSWKNKRRWFYLTIKKNIRKPEKKSFSVLILGK